MNKWFIQFGLWIFLGVYGNTQQAQAQQAASCPDSDTSFKCQQQRQLKAILVDLNQSVGPSIKTFVSDPGTVFESGCLDEIAGINLSIFRIDPTSIWTEVYQQLKDEITNRVCTKIQDKINEHRERLNITLEAPFGLGSVSVSNGAGIESTHDIFRVQDNASNNQIRRRVVEEVFGSPPTAPVRDFQENIITLPNTSHLQTPRQKRKKEEERITKFIDINKLWGKKADEEAPQNEDQDGNKP